MSTFSMSLMSAEGSPCSTTMSAALPGAIVPILSSSPRIRRRSKWRCEWGLERREACLDEKFHFALVAESGDHAAVSGGIESREEQTAAFDEFAFELELLLKERGPKRIGGAIGDRGAPLQVFDASVRKHGVEDACVERSTIGHEGLEHGKRRCDSDVMSDEIVDH